MNQIFTPVTLWQDFDFNQPLDISVLNEYTENGITYREVQFSGRIIENPAETLINRPRIYGMSAIKEGYENLPVVMIINDFSLTIDKSFLNYFAKTGYCAFMVDVGGANPNYLKYTEYPDSIAYANYLKRNKTGEVEKTAKETCWYEWTAVCRYGISYLKEVYPESEIGVFGIRSGGNIAWQLAAIENRIKASCSLFAAGWKLSDKTELTLDMQKWLAGISTESYAIKVKVPMMYLSDSNDDYCHMDKAYDTLKRVPEDVPLLYAFSARLKNIIGYKNSKNILLFFSKFLKNKSITIPKTPKLTGNIEQGKVILKLSADTFDNIEEVDIVYAEDETNPEIRNWKNLEFNKLFEGVYQGECEIFSNQSSLFAYACVSYANGFTVSSNLLSIKPDSTKLNLTAKPKGSLIYNSDMGKDSFTCYAFDEDAKGVDILMETPNTKIVLGPMGIHGITTSYKALASYKISDPSFNSDSERIFKFDVYSESPQKLDVYFMENKANQPAKVFKTQINLVGGQVWQPVEIKCDELKSEEGYALKNWSSVSMFAFKSDIPAVYNNILWL